ncbi:MAG: 50S ribosomal protein L21 [Patescibacteria group bacterium]
MKYAVVKIGGSQYKVSEGDEIEVLRLPQKEGEEIEFPEVLLLVSEAGVKIGQPQVSGVTVKAKILSHFKAEKIRVARFKAKSRYRKVKGFRAALTRIRIEKIETAKAQKTS